MPEQQFLTAEALLAEMANKPLIAFAHPAPERLEFTYLCEEDYEGPCLPDFVKQYILRRIQKAGLFQAVLTEVPGFGPAVLCATIVPPDGGAIAADVPEGQ